MGLHVNFNFAILYLINFNEHNIKITNKKSDNYNMLQIIFRLILFNQDDIVMFLSYALYLKYYYELFLLYLSIK